MNEQKLIYIEDLEKALYDEPCDVCDGQNDNGGYWGFSRDALNEIIKIVPTVDAIPVVHGHWILHHVVAGHYWECSICHKNPDIYITEHTYYCPNCGAKMDETD